VLFELSEFELYAIERKLTQLATQVKIIPILGSVLDANKLARVIRRFGNVLGSSGSVVKVV
jgi:FlaA1/EpsC-like NDP-sugar epimerase